MQLDPFAEPFHADAASTDGSRIGILLSHGFTGSPASMRPWGEFLAEQGYAVAVPRLPGHGTRVEDMLTTTYDDYLEELEREYAALADKVDTVVLAGLSMGGCLVLDLASRHPEVAGVVVVNPAVNSTNKQLLALPLMKHVVKTFPGIANDIKKPGVQEHGYTKTPLRPLATLLTAWKRVRDVALPKVTCPVLLFRSAEDHVVDPSSARIILGRISSRDATERVLENSYHVATVDNDAEDIFAESLEFIRRVTA